MKRMLMAVCLFPAIWPACAESADANPAFELKEGDRIALIGATFMERDRHFGEFEAVLRSSFSGVRLSFRNMAWPGDTTTVQLRPLNFGSLEKHLTAQKPTVVFVSYGANEAYDGEAGLSQFLAGYSTILDLLSKTGARVVIVSPVRHENLGPPLPDPAAVNRNLELYTKAIQKLAHDRDLPFVDLFHSLVESSATPPAYPLTENGVHLTDYGYWRAARALANQLGRHEEPWKVEITLGRSSNDINATGVRISGLKTGEQTVVFQATDMAVPIPAPEGPPPDASGIVSTRVLKVKGLKPGRYTLRIDDKNMATATADEWGKGVVLRGGPQFERGASLRSEVVWKNLMFFNRWRSHNGEYIYGRRSLTSEGYDRSKDGGNSGNPSFPGEMAEFDRLLEASDRKTDELSKPLTHNYEIVPSKAD